MIDETRKGYSSLDIGEWPGHVSIIQVAMLKRVHALLHTHRDGYRLLQAFLDSVPVDNRTDHEYCNERRIALGIAPVDPV